ncbi:MAG: GyrI-like domain-containing protein [Candidatus Thiodiazotropha sp.]
MNKNESFKVYIRRVNRVIDYIKDNLDGDVSLERLSVVANFSKYHFHRIFKAVTGENVNAYIGRQRAEKSAFMLLYNPSQSITSIAYDVGYSSPSVFSREFKSIYELSPSNWRKIRNSNICKVESNSGKESIDCELYLDFSKTKPLWRNKMSQKFELNIEVREMPDIPIAYFRHHGAYDPFDKELFQSLFQKLMSWAVPLNLFKPPQTKALTIYSSGHPDTTEPDKLAVDVAISLENALNVTGDIGIRSIPAGQYAVVSLVDVTMDESGKAWDTLFNDWLPHSGYQPGDGAYYINHQNDPEQHPQKLYTLEMYLPVKPL